MSDSASNGLWSAMGVRGGDTLVLGERGCVCVNCVDSGCVVVGCDCDWDAG